MFDKIWDAHVVAEGPGGQTLFEGRRRAEAPWLFG
jgi:hypothetical protein